MWGENRGAWQGHPPAAPVTAPLACCAQARPRPADIAGARPAPGHAAEAIARCAAEHEGRLTLVALGAWNSACCTCTCTLYGGVSLELAYGRTLLVLLFLVFNCIP